MSTVQTTKSCLSHNYDIIIQILDHLEEQYSTLFICTLVNRTFNAAASRLLYRQVIFSPPYQRGVVDLRRRDEFTVSNRLRRWFSN